MFWKYHVKRPWKNCAVILVFKWVFFFQKSDVIWSLGHCPCSVLGLVYRNQENIFGHCWFQSTRVRWSWVIFLLGCQESSKRTRNYTIRRGVRAGRRTKERQLNSTRAISVNIQTRRMKRNNPRVCIPENCVRILPSRAVPISSTPPSILLTNACHLGNKIEELRCITDINNTPVVIIAESWLSSDIPTSVITLSENYSTHRMDRVNRQGGAVVAYIHTYIHTYAHTHTYTYVYWDSLYRASQSQWANHF